MKVSTCMSAGGGHLITSTKSSINHYLLHKQPFAMNSEKIVAIILGMYTSESLPTSLKALTNLTAIFLPPLAVFMKCGVSTPFWINIVCCIFFWFPAILHALYVVLQD